MTVALYLSIWLALVALLISELGRRRGRPLVSARVAILGSFSGVLLTGIHTLLALAAAYGWDHARAVAVTAERAAAVYGVAWPGSLYVNYVFLAWWLIDTIWWWRAPASFLGRPRAIEWLWRMTAFTMVVNGAIIFASTAGRIAGVPLAVALMLAWAPRLKHPLR
jgi:hypothetical protein